MFLTRRRLIATLGGTAAALGAKPLLGSSAADVKKCKVNCQGEEKPPAGCVPPAPPNVTELVYLPAPDPNDPLAAVPTVRENFRVGLAENATPAQVVAFMEHTDIKQLFKTCYEDELVTRVRNKAFDGAKGAELWTRLNDHAYILGQLTGTLARDPTPPGVRSFLRAKSQFSEAISFARCECFINKRAYRLPKTRKTITATPRGKLELDQECCLC